MGVLKIVVTGAFNSGKSTFIKTLSEVVPIETEAKITTYGRRLKPTTTVALDYGRIRVADDLVVHLFGTPGQRRFSFMWRVLARGMHGYILLVDSADPSSVDEARYVYAFFRRNWNLPHIVGANKQDLPSALPPEHVRALLSVPPDTPVVPLVATDPHSVKSALLTLVDHMIEWYAKKSEQSRHDAVLSSQRLL